MAEIEKRPVKIVETVLRDAHQSLLALCISAIVIILLVMSIWHRIFKALVRYMHPRPAGASQAGRNGCHCRYCYPYTQILPWYQPRRHANNALATFRPRRRSAWVCFCSAFWDTRPPSGTAAGRTDKRIKSSSCNLCRGAYLKAHRRQWKVNAVRPGPTILMVVTFKNTSRWW